MDNNVIHKTSIVRASYLIPIWFFSIMALMIDPKRLVIENAAFGGVSGFITLLCSEFREVSISDVLAIILIGFVFSKVLFTAKRSISRSALLASGVIALFILLGLSYSTFGDLTFIILCKKQFLIAMLVFLGYLSLIYTCLKCLFIRLDSGCFLRQSKVPFLFKKVTFVRLFLLIIVAWIVLMLPFFPGSVPHDGRFQLNMFFWYSPMTSHHPFASTLLTGGLYKLGFLLGGITGGCVANVLFRAVTASIVFALVCRYIWEKSSSSVLLLAALLFYMFAPMWWSYAQTITKDPLFFTAFTLFYLQFFKVVFGDIDRKGFYVLVVAGVLCCLMRHDAVFILVPATIVLVFMSDKKRCALLLSLFIVVAHLSVNVLLMSYLDIPKSNPLESCSVPLQQIARYVTYYGEELDSSEIEIIDDVIVFEGIPERYDPEIADYIKNRHREIEPGDMEKLFALWMDMLKKHPMVFFDGFMNEAFGYIDPFYHFDGLGSYQLYNKGPIAQNDEKVVYSSYVFPDRVRNGATDLAQLWNNIPVLNMITSPGAYTCMGIVLLTLLLRRRLWKLSLSFLGPIVVVAVCLASPVNGYLRYMLPIMSTMPLFVLAALRPYLYKEKQ